MASGMHLNPLVVPLQEPERCWLVGHVIRSHGLHLPGLAPNRYWLVLQTTLGRGAQHVMVNVTNARRSRVCTES